jgi:hypothetical protein
MARNRVVSSNEANNKKKLKVWKNHVLLKKQYSYDEKDPLNIARSWPQNNEIKLSNLLAFLPSCETQWTKLSFFGAFTELFTGVLKLK